MERIKYFLLSVLEYIGKKILLYSLAISGLVALTFLVTREFSFNALSDRLVWVGLFMFLASVVVWMGVFSAGRQYGVPSMIVRPEDAKKFLNNQSQIRENIEKRYGAAIQIWVIGFVCIGIGALVQVIANRLMQQGGG